jgi:hypothetical protein
MRWQIPAVRQMEQPVGQMERVVDLSVAQMQIVTCSLVLQQVIPVFVRHLRTHTPIQMMPSHVQL